MSWRSLILAVTIIAGSPDAFSKDKSMAIDTQELRMKAFEKKIDFYHAQLSHVPSEKISFDWKNIGTPQHLQGWKLVDKRYDLNTGKNAREIWQWAYTKNSQGIGIEITSYKTGDRDSLMAIRDLANMSSLAEPPFFNGPTDLGTISLALPRTNGYILYWAYRDLEFKLDASEKDVALRTAYWLQSIAESHRQAR